MSDHTRTIALISDVFWQDDGSERLLKRLFEARDMGAEAAVIPELAMNKWSPATKHQVASDAEFLGGPRCQVQMEAAQRAGIGLIGAAILRDEHGARFNTALVINSSGMLVGSWEKAHIPDEPGFWEADHYDQGRDSLTPIDGLGFPLGVQICSDVNRPQGTQLLAAAGAECVLVPRASESASWHRWRPVLIANALTSCCWVATVNRPAPEEGVLLGGPSFAVDPNGDVLVESTDPVCTFSYKPHHLEAHRSSYPGYLSIRSDLYATGWSAIPPRH
jgi:N-carbamoylputrescine amidase